MTPSKWRQTMSSKTNAISNRRTKRSLPEFRRRFRRRHNPAVVRAADPPNNGDSTPSSSDVSAKLEALQSLIPAQSTAVSDEIRPPEQLFKETADYIVRLETKVFILQKLVDFFGSGYSDAEKAVVS